MYRLFEMSIEYQCHITDRAGKITPVQMTRGFTAV